MNEIVKPDIDSHLGLSRPSMTMAGVIEAVRQDPALPTTRKRDLISAIKRLCELLALDPATTVARSRRIREKLREFHWLQAGISRKTFQNIRSGVEYALDRYAHPERPTYGTGLSDDWDELRCQVTGELRYRLSRLMSYCSGLGMPPHAVDDPVMAEFGDWLIDGTLVERPDALYRATIRSWNKAAATVEAWPATRLMLPATVDRYCLAWEDIPEPLRGDIEAWLDRLAHADPLDDRGPPRPVRPATAKHRRFQTRQLVSALARRGHGIAGLCALADLVEIETAREALRFFLDRNGGKTSSQIYGLASVICAIAEHWVEVNGEHLDRLKRIKGNLAYTVQGLTPRNRRRLLQFADHRNLVALLGLPHRIFDRIRKKSAITLADARDMQVAVATETLLMAPVRRRNLVALNLDENFIVRGRGRHRSIWIDFPAEAVKNRIDLTYPIPQESVALLDFYISRCLPLVQRPDERWLFPGDLPGRHKSLDQFSRLFSATIRRLTGLEINMHLMRHLGAKLYLDENPGAYEIVRRVLGHKRMSTTVNNYTGLETEAAIRHFDAVILGIRSGIQHEADDDDGQD